MTLTADQWTASVRRSMLHMWQCRDQRLGTPPNPHWRHKSTAKQRLVRSSIAQCCPLCADWDDKHGYCQAVVNEVVADTAEDGAFDGAEASSTNTDEVRLLIHGHLEDPLARILHRLTRSLEVDLSTHSTGGHHKRSLNHVCLVLSFMYNQIQKADTLSSYCHLHLSRYLSLLFKITWHKPVTRTLVRLGPI